MEQMDLQEKVRRQYEKTGKPICRAGEIREEMLPMPDGARLLTEICLPEGLADEAFPVILMRSCYPSSREERELVMKEYACRGFGFVLQWCRGTGGSEGVWEPNVNERADGLATLDWLSAQPWVKNIGYWGDSYLALTGWCMADAVPEKVKTMVLGVYGTARFTSAYKDGLFRQDVLTHWAKENAGKPVDADTMESYRYRPQVEVDEALWGVRLPWYRDWITHTDANDPYWQQGFWGMLHNIPAQVKIPLFIREGWYDHHLGSALKTYDALPEEIRRKSLLQIGPWNHIYRAVIPQEKSEHALERDVVGIVDWFRAVLMRGETPKGEVQEYVIGADRWITRSSRAESGKSRVFYAGADSRTLGDIPPETDSKVSYLYDPENPVPSHGAESLLHDLQERMGLTYLFIAHDLNIVKYISDRIAVMYLGSMVELATSDELYANTLHPYSKALLSAVPIPDPKLEAQKKRQIIEGDVPSPINKPKGCAFSSRCPLACDKCRQSAPVLKEAAPGHFVACHLVEG